MNEVLGLILVSIGLFFDFTGCIGLVRLPDIYNRLHAAAKCVTMGTSLILFGCLVYKGISPIGVKAIICAVFIMMTSPTAAHALARGAHIFGVKLWEKSVCDKYEEDKNKGR